MDDFHELPLDLLAYREYELRERYAAAIAAFDAACIDLGIGRDSRGVRVQMSYGERPRFDAEIVINGDIRTISVRDWSFDVIVCRTIGIDGAIWGEGLDMQAIRALELARELWARMSAEQEALQRPSRT